MCLTIAGREHKVIFCRHQRRRPPCTGTTEFLPASGSELSTKADMLIHIFLWYGSSIPHNTNEHGGIPMNITVYVNADGLISVRFPNGVVPDRDTLERISCIIMMIRTEAA